MTRNKASKCAPAGGMLIVLAAALMAPAAGAQGAGGRDQSDQALAYAQCMRDNGFTEFPDPASDGRLSLRVDGQSAGRFRTAQQACRDLAPQGLVSEGVTQERIQQLVGFAECMRENGVAEFPDPTSDGQFDLGGLNIDMDSASTRAAMTACRSAGGPAGAGGLMIRR